MPPPPKDPDKIPKPRASRVKSGKPTPPPLETAAGTPEVRARGKGGRKRAEQTTASGMSEAPQADFGDQRRRRERSRTLPPAPSRARATTWRRRTSRCRRCASRGRGRRWAASRSASISTRCWPSRSSARPAPRSCCRASRCSPRIRSSPASSRCSCRTGPPRPEKSEGGIALQARVGVRAQGRPAHRHRRAGRRRQRARAQPGAARRHRLGQDLHHGQGDRGARSARR